MWKHTIKYNYIISDNSRRNDERVVVVLPEKVTYSMSDYKERCRNLVAIHTGISAHQIEQAFVEKTELVNTAPPPPKQVAHSRDYEQEERDEETRRMKEILLRDHGVDMISDPNKIQFVKNTKNGYDSESFSNGDEYEGNFVDGKFDGTGTYTYAVGAVYEGNWKNSKKNGFGKFTGEDGIIFEGEYKDDSRVRGQITYPDGGQYFGAVKGRTRHGQGKMIFADGRLYDGEWLDDEPVDMVEESEPALKNGWHSDVYDNGKYEGDLVEGIREGNGIYTWNDGHVYMGEWKNGERNGPGGMTYPNGDVYEGFWLNNKRNGKGKLIRKDDGTIFKGEWNDNKLVNEIEVTYLNGDVYCGELENWKRHGKGRLTHPIGYPGLHYEDGTWENDNFVGWPKEMKRFDNGSMYEGGFDTSGNLTGVGKMIYINGNVYEGNWEINGWNGSGKLMCVNGDYFECEFDVWSSGNEKGKGKYANGDIYEGEFERVGNSKTEDCKELRRNGMGKMTYADGRVLECEWVDDYPKMPGMEVINENGGKYIGEVNGKLKHGKGKYIWANGDVYEGDWVKGIRTGKGKYIWASGSVYEGDWIENLRTGKGKLTWPDGDFFEGDWVNNNRCGHGKFIRKKDGVIFEGEYKDDKRGNYGKLTYSNGDVYIGSVDGWNKVGKGKMTYADGLIYDGEWKDDEIVSDAGWIVKEVPVAEVAPLVVENKNTPPPPPPMPAIYHVLIDNEQTGPFTMGQLKEFVTNRQLNRESYVWKTGLADWVKMNDLPELASVFANVPPPPPRG